MPPAKRSKTSTPTSTHALDPSVLPTPATLKRAASSAPTPTDPFAAKPRKLDSFPLVSVMEKADMQRVVEIMEECSMYADYKDGLDEEVKEMKQELVALGEKYSIPGARFGSFVTYLGGMKTKRTMIPRLVKQWFVEQADVGLQLLKLHTTLRDAIAAKDDKTIRTCLTQLMLAGANMANTSATLESFYQTSEPYADVRVVDLNKPKRKRDGAEEDDE